MSGLDRQAMERKLRQGARLALEELAAASGARAPRETGELAASCRVEMDAAGPSGRVVYTAPYAVYQHEKTELRHGKGGAKFLEEAAGDPAVRSGMLRAMKKGME